MSKIVSQIKLKQIVDSLKRKKKKIAFTCGCFDLLHIGHTRSLLEAKSHGDVLIVGVNSDSGVKKIKGKCRPIVPEDERAEIIASLECVDYVIIFSENRPDNLIKVIKPDIHVKGGDYKVSQLPERKLVEGLGGKAIVIPPIEGRSTTNIVERILSRK